MLHKRAMPTIQPISKPNATLIAVISTVMAAPAKSSGTDLAIKSKFIFSQSLQVYYYSNFRRTRINQTHKRILQLMRYSSICLFLFTKPLNIKLIIFTVLFQFHQSFIYLCRQFAVFFSSNAIRFCFHFFADSFCKTASCLC